MRKARIVNKIINVVKVNMAIFFLFLGIIIFQLLATTIVFYEISLKSMHSELEKRIVNIKKDVNYKNGKWDLSFYNADPQLIGTNPLYFITTEGFVLDRRSPIHGFLDTSDFKFLLAYKNPQTLQTITDQTRRVFAKPILYKNSSIGVIAVSYFNPQDELLSEIDNKLIQTAATIASKVNIINGGIDVGKIDERQIPYGLSFTIVDHYNTILKKTTNVNNINRIPNFIDPSYVKTQFTLPSVRTIQDTQTKEYFLTAQSTLKNQQGSPLAIIIVGQSIENILRELQQLIFWDGVASIFIFLGSVVIFIKYIPLKGKSSSSQHLIPENILFNQKKGLLIIDGTDIEIPYATNQFYLLQCLFSNPSKRWETDELLERFGEESVKVNSRKVYDAMVSINKKVASIVQIKLIFNQNKTYQLNPTILASK